MSRADADAEGRERCGDGTKIRIKLSITRE